MYEYCCVLLGTIVYCCVLLCPVLFSGVVAREVLVQVVEHFGARERIVYTPAYT